MQDAGCVIVLIGLVAVVVGVTVASVINAKTRRANRLARGEQIAKLFDRIAANSCDQNGLSVLAALLSGEPVGFEEQLVMPGGWFDRALPALTRFSHDPNHGTYVEWFFTCFTFTTGKQSAPLAWLQSLLATGHTEPSVLVVFESIAGRLLRNSSSGEAMWLYQRLLDGVAASGGDPRIKALALRIGRIAHAKSRTNGLVTMYDEQAIANDISARIPPPTIRD